MVSGAGMASIQVNLPLLTGCQMNQTMLEETRTALRYTQTVNGMTRSAQTAIPTFARYILTSGLYQ